MCGICGIVYTDENRSVDSRILNPMCDTMLHRGPDDKGLFIDKNIGLAMRRLSIIDLTTGHQPMSNEDGTIWIVYNGEFYNFIENRDVLIKKGHIFKTHSDTEVIIHLYEEYGVHCLEKINGMFAFAIWDYNQKKLFIARDRIGIKPLHYTFVNNIFLFASEIKAILKYPDFPRQIDLYALNRYLTFEYVPTPHTIYKNIRKLPAGHYILLKNGKMSIRKYWDIRSFRTLNETIDEGQVGEKIRELLQASVKRRLISDVPLGVFLSGGIDSSTIVAMMRKMGQEQIKTFSIGFENKTFDETNYARNVAKLFRTEHHQQIFSSQKIKELIPKVTTLLDEPFADNSIFPTYLLSKFTREYVKVTLGGEGGDELFAGYPTHQAHIYARFYQMIPRLIRTQLIEPAVKALPVSTNNISFDFKAKKFISGIAYSPEIRHHVWLGGFVSDEKDELFTPDIADEIEKDDCFFEVKNFYSHLDGSDFINKILFLDTRFYLGDEMLFKIDRATMAASLESRVPFLDHTLLEYVVTLPSRFKLRGIRTKYILKKLAADFLPKTIISRPKKGFGAPVSQWIKTDLKPVVEELLQHDKLKREGIFNPRTVRRLLDEHLSGRKDNRLKLWPIVMFEFWYERYMRQ